MSAYTSGHHPVPTVLCCLLGGSILVLLELQQPPLFHHPPLLALPHSEFPHSRFLTEIPSHLLSSLLSTTVPTMSTPSLPNDTPPHMATTSIPGSGFHNAMAKVPVLTGKENFPKWKTSLILYLGSLGARGFIQNDKSQMDDATWRARDEQIAYSILLTTSSPIQQSLFHLLEETSSTSLSSTVYDTIVLNYGAADAQSVFDKGRELLGSTCQEGGDVAEWTHEVMARYEELKGLKWTLEDTVVNVLLHGLPSGEYQNYVYNVLANPTRPTPTDVSTAIRRLAAHQKSSRSFGPPDESALVASRVKLRPSAENPCRLCKAPDHWSQQCPRRNASVPAEAAMATVDEEGDSDGSAY
ncbi:hypothetical protein L202_08459 [Cryptococcus amylolentus CBS 6039]|uniref:Retrotransposon Copia-like N-terminal domain-containing protein n=1 Tax=Cryptococcus amylolentus CBS 6039 TaxID=1295533 RepID=A0A1E3H9T7_9TREE|nr:hypothetical protein L202_08459 [Cryptococcus amylolentus CBS 6039]ODN73064.1 hypothetical protein L202_08459 [Cryptococcus amylolentus CBS 6039]